MVGTTYGPKGAVKGCSRTGLTFLTYRRTPHSLHVTQRSRPHTSSIFRHSSLKWLNDVARFREWNRDPRLGPQDIAHAFSAEREALSCILLKRERQFGLRAEHTALRRLRPKRPRYMYFDVSDVYPKMYPGLVWDTCKIHAKYQDTCILLECNRAFKIHFEIHQDTSGIHVSRRCSARRGRLGIASEHARILAAPADVSPSQL